MFEILSINRDLQGSVKEEVQMLSQIKLADLPTFQTGREERFTQGMQQGGCSKAYDRKPPICCAVSSVAASGRSMPPCKPESKKRHSNASSDGRGASSMLNLSTNC